MPWLKRDIVRLGEVFVFRTVSLTHGAVGRRRSRQKVQPEAASSADEALAVSVSARVLQYAPRGRPRLRRNPNLGLSRALVLRRNSRENRGSLQGTTLWLCDQDGKCPSHLSQYENGTAGSWRKTLHEVRRWIQPEQAEWGLRPGGTAFTLSRWSRVSLRANVWQ